VLLEIEWWALDGRSVDIPLARTVQHRANLKPIQMANYSLSAVGATPLRL
jgi:hypothetical protein